MIRSASTYALPIAIFHTPFVQVGITATSERGATSEAHSKGLFLKLCRKACHAHINYTGDFKSFMLTGKPNTLS